MPHHELLISAREKQEMMAGTISTLMMASSQHRPDPQFCIFVAKNPGIERFLELPIEVKDAPLPDVAAVEAPPTFALTWSN